MPAVGVVPNGSAEVLAIEMPVSTLGQFATLVKRRVDGAVLLGSVTTSAETVIAAAEAVPHVAQALAGKRIVRRIHVPNRIVNFVTAG